MTSSKLGKPGKPTKPCKVLKRGEYDPSESVDSKDMDDDLSSLTYDPIRELRKQVEIRESRLDTGDK